MRHSVKLLAMGAFAVALLGAGQRSAAAQTILKEVGTPYTASAMTGFTTTGGQMSGLTATAFFADNTSDRRVWQSTGPALGAAAGPRFSLSQQGDTYFSDWMLTNSYSAGLTRLLLEGAPGGIVFDTPSGEGTPGSSLGYEFTLTSGLSAKRARATYRNAVSLFPSAAVGDLYETLDLSFDGAGLRSGHSLFFRQDTDSVLGGAAGLRVASLSATDTPSDVSSVPEPASVPLLPPTMTNTQSGVSTDPDPTSLPLMPLELTADTLSDVSTVPEPASVLLMLPGLAAVGLWMRRKKDA